jgi:hypothetical protein
MVLQGTPQQLVIIQRGNMKLKLKTFFLPNDCVVILTLILNHENTYT